MAIPIESIRPKTNKPKNESFSSKWNSSNIRFEYRNGLSDRVKEEFYRELALMFTTGIDIRLALEIIGSEIKSKKTQLVFEAIKQMLVKGKTLSEALETTGKFSNYEFANIKIGEESGTLKDVLSQLAIHYKHKISQRKQLIGALSYPVLVLLTSIGAVGFMLQVVVPMFEDVFKRFGSDLPWLTKMVVALSDTISENFRLFVLFVLAFISLGYFFRNKIWFQKYLTGFLVSIPFFGQIVKSAQLAKFSSAMYLLTTSKHPLVGSLNLVSQMITFYPIKRSLNESENEIIKGKTLSCSLNKHPFYPKKMIALLKMAEEVNKMDLIFAQLRDQYQDDVSYRSGLLSSVLEPILIIFIGTMVGFILIAMYLPLFELSTSIG